LRNNEQVAKGIEELQVRNERKAEMAALSKDELIVILTEIVHATRARLSEARPGDGLKAAEMLAKMCGWNEPERVNVQSVGVLLPNRRITIVQVSHDKRIDRNKRIHLLPNGFFLFRDLKESPSSRQQSLLATRSANHGRLA
jgi:hypothetical protein